jgi:hypothetical protein
MYLQLFNSNSRCLHVDMDVPVVYRHPYLLQILEVNKMTQTTSKYFFKIKYNQSSLGTDHLTSRGGYGFFLKKIF